jgi:type II secretory pathway component PulF
MALFRYHAVGAAGKTIKGVIDADSLLAAKERLRKQQVMVTSVIHLQRGRAHSSLFLAALFHAGACATAEGRTSSL